MKTLSAPDAKNSFDVLLDTARREPITIEKKRRPVAVILSTAEYEHLAGLGDVYLLVSAGTVEAEGYRGSGAGGRCG